MSITNIIIARYKENIDWSNLLNISKENLYVYDKFYHENSNLVLPNIGRESQTYLHHIIKNYDNLSDYLIFLQGDPIFHNNNIINNINLFLSHVSNENYQNKELFIPLSPVVNIEGLNAVTCPSRHPHGLPMYYFLNLLFENYNTTYIECNYGAQFIVSKHNILCRPKRFYEFLIKFVSSETHPIEAYILERLWEHIFNPSIKLNNKYLLFI